MKLTSLYSLALWLPALVSASPVTTTSVHSTSTTKTPTATPTIKPEFYIQVTNGTNKGKFLSAPTYVVPTERYGVFGAKHLLYVNNLANASLFTIDYQSPAGTPTLSLGGKQSEQHFNIASPGDDSKTSQTLLVGSETFQTTGQYSLYPIYVNVDGWKAGAATGKIHPADVSKPQWRGWVESPADKAIAVAELGIEDAKYIGLQYLRYSK